MKIFFILDLVDGIEQLNGYIMLSYWSCAIFGVVGYWILIWKHFDKKNSIFNSSKLTFPPTSKSIEKKICH